MTPLDRLPDRLWHYTCTHSAQGILSEPTPHIRPRSHPLLTDPDHPRRPLQLAWFTDLDQPHAAALGLTARTLACDRTRNRFEVAVTDAMHWWPAWRRAYLAAGGSWVAVRHLETAAGAMPAHWWVTDVPTPVVPSTPHTTDPKGTTTNP